MGFVDIYRKLMGWLSGVPVAIGPVCVCESLSFTSGCVEQIAFDTLAIVESFTPQAVNQSQFTPQCDSAEFTSGCVEQMSECHCRLEH